MPNLAERVRNHRLFGVLAVYLGVSWLILQVVDIVKQNLGLPDWIFPFALLLLLIGLPIIVATAFLQGGSQAAKVSLARTAAADPAKGAGVQEWEDAGRRLFTWRNALIGGGLAFLLLAVVTGGFMYMRSAGIGPVGSLVAKGVLDEQSRIVLAEFEAADSVLARTVTESFRVDLAQSPVVDLVEPDSIANGLARMNRPEDTPLSEETARELAVRDGYPAVVAGELAPVGAGYVLTARLVASDDGAVLASARASARDEAALLDAIDDVSSKLREQIGESYTSLRGSPSLAHVTTGSLEALKKYTQAYDARHREGNPEAAIRLLEQAVTIDSTFALAWRDLGTILSNQGGSWARKIDASERAYRFRDRLSERERYLVEANYYQEVADDPRRVIETYEAMLRLDSLDAQALNNIGFTYYNQADWENALEWYERSHVAAPDVPMHLANVATTQANLGNLGAADSLYGELDAVSTNPDWDNWRAAYLWMKGDEEGARSVFESVLRDHPNRSAATGWARWALSDLEAVRGHLGAAAEARLSLADDLIAAGAGERALGILVGVASLRLEVARDTMGALAVLDRALERIDPEALAALDRPWYGVANLLAEAGEVERARGVWERAWEETPELLKPGAEKYRADERGRVAAAEGRPLEALAELRSLPPPPCTPCRVHAEARLLDQAERPDSAIAAYERFLAEPFNYRLFFDARWLASTHERLGQLYDEKGDLENAALHYARFVELWEDADPELQPRVRTAQQRLEAILRERG